MWSGDRNVGSQSVRECHSKFDFIRTDQAGTVEALGRQFGAEFG